MPETAQAPLFLRMIVDQMANWRLYRLGEAWERAFSFLETLGADADVKEYPLDGDAIFARVMSYETKDDSAEDLALEAHRRYADIQMPLAGEERIAVFPTPSLTTKAPYDERRDVEFFERERPALWQIGLAPGEFALLLPQDAHTPQLRVTGGSPRVKKVVVKVALDRLSFGG